MGDRTVVRVRVVLAAAAVVATAVLHGGAAAQSGAVVARGGYVGAGCVPTTASTGSDGAFSCSGASTYSGYFTTANPFTVTGRLQLDTTTGRLTARGVVDEWHHGRAADGSVGTFRTFQTFVQHADGTGEFRGCILEGTGEWARASGTLTAVGWQGVGAVAAHGGYAFLWKREGSEAARAQCAREKERATRALARG